ncbi:MAG: TIGR04084 family radical SAM/SPASM domain-containing protein [Methanomicrobiaceae archaeon]|uniref:Radical sam domain protein n=1 Tax=hydrocarbon metagenome TaxID=938273 RepID=A0A0W8FE60_9ZZZZ|nr:TIGR04084 family radical SAM/SPASM domain-containing protein [Methanomicrobiaceae archaeon]MDD5419206.1 TIGR04084 family radical SAM/SPASM domain-containing protein [Methanomicrobiaceae archaeon]
MYYHLILTDSCNLCCTYCRAKAFDLPEYPDSKIAIDDTPPPDLAIDHGLLYAFLRRDPDAVLTFYGGEPLLRIDLIREIMHHAPAKGFMLHTNGLLLDRLERELVNRLDAIFVSIDGPEDLNDAYRGEGTFRRVIANLKKIIANGYQGEIIARMTVAEKTDIWEAVQYLSRNAEFPFTSVHWQLDANFSQDFHQRDFASWVSASYNPGIRALVDAWVERMRKEGVVLRWYPFIATMQDLLLGQKSLLRCGCGHANYTILTDGSIAPCPCMIGMKEYYLGHIARDDPCHLGIASVEQPCRDCSLLDFCGGRCLYANIMRPWPEEGINLVCSTVENLHGALLAALPEVRRLIGEGRISINDFEHARFNGCEVIP